MQLDLLPDFHSIDNTEDEESELPKAANFAHGSIPPPIKLLLSEDIVNNEITSASLDLLTYVSGMRERAERRLSERTINAKSDKSEWPESDSARADIRAKRLGTNG